jgi:hypothetical protein
LAKPWKLCASEMEEARVSESISRHVYGTEFLYQLSQVRLQSDIQQKEAYLYTGFTLFQNFWKNCQEIDFIGKNL